MEEQWEFEYERILGSKDCERGDKAEVTPSEVKVAFHAGWDAALTAILERFNATTQ